MRPSDIQRAAHFELIRVAELEKVYRAFLDPDAKAKWLPPNGFTGKVHELEAKVGGRYRMSFTNFTTGQTHFFGGTFVELTPYERIRYTDTFEDPNLPGKETGHDHSERSDVRDGVERRAGGHTGRDPARNVLHGWQESLILLGSLVEVDIPD